MEPDGRVVTCEIDEAIATTAKRHSRHAGVADKIELRLGRALETLDTMLTQGRHGYFDMAFIDADKENLLGYYEGCHALMRVGGLIVGGLIFIDNTLWGGSVADDSDHDPSTDAIRAFNVFVHEDQRVEMVLLPIGDGLTLARKIA